MSGRMAVVDGATLKCSKGRGKSLLHPTTPSKIKVENKDLVTIQDHWPDDNVPPFEYCKTLGGDCVPNLPAPWHVSIFSGVQVSSFSAEFLPSDAQLDCENKGVIKIEDPGQSSVPLGVVMQLKYLTEAAALELALLEEELRKELLRLGIDTVGIADPTPIADGISGFLSFKEGDLIGGFLSAGSMIPWAGDALFKGPKLARVANKIKTLVRAIREIRSAARLARDAAKSLPALKGMPHKRIRRELSEAGFTRVKVSNSPGRNETWVHPDGSKVLIHPYGGVKTAPHATANNAHIHKRDSMGNRLNDSGVPSTDPNETHIGISNPPDLPAVRNRPHGEGK